MSSNIHGNKNEIDFINALNNKKFKDLNNNLKNFILYVANAEHIRITNNTLILANKITGMYKSDLFITIDEKTFNISIKMGKGNSVHQEKLYKFNDYAINNLRIEDGDIVAISEFINSTKTSKELMKENPQLINTISSFLQRNKRELLYYFLVCGVYNKYNPDYFYYGDYKDGLWCKMDYLIDYLCDPQFTSSVPTKVSSLTFQAWNRKNIKKQGYIQIKWNSLKNDLLKIDEFKSMEG